MTVALAVGAKPGGPGAPAPARLAIVASHPVQYLTPWYRALAKLVDLRVFFAHRVNAADHARAGFAVEFEWDASIFDGYDFEWLTNRARQPRVDAFLGCDTREIGPRLVGGRFDAVVVNGWNLLTYWQAVYAARRAGLPVFVRGDSHLGAQRGRARRLGRAVLYPRLLKAFDAYLTVGIRNAAYYKRYGVDESRIYRSPHCVDNEFFARGAAAARADLSATRRALGLPADAVVFALVGKLVEVKRPLDFVRALDAAARANRQVHGLIVGDGPLRPVLEAHCRANATPCAFAGFLNQRATAQAYGAADCVVLPSASETWGLVVNEGMAAGLPAIVTKQVGCAPDLIVEGQTGFTCPGGDVHRLAESMGRVAADGALRGTMRRCATARIAAFSPEAAAAGVIAALDSVRDGSRRRQTEGNTGSHVIDAVS